MQQVYLSQGISGIVFFIVKKNRTSISCKSISDNIEHKHGVHAVYTLNERRHRTQNFMIITYKQLITIHILTHKGSIHALMSCQHRRASNPVPYDYESNALPLIYSQVLGYRFLFLFSFFFLFFLIFILYCY